MGEWILAWAAVAFGVVLLVIGMLAAMFGGGG